MNDNLTISSLVKCPTCATPFTPRRPWQKFCCKACRNAYHLAIRKRALALLNEREKS